MGGVFTAVAEGADALYWNPAGLGRLRVSSIRVTNADLHGPGIRDNLVSLVFPFGGSFGAGMEWYHSGFEDASIDDNLNRLSFALGWQFMRQVSVGGTVKYNQYSQAYEGVDQGRGSGFGGDLGLLFQPYRKLWLGRLRADDEPRRSSRTSSSPVSSATARWTAPTRSRASAASARVSRQQGRLCLVFRHINEVVPISGVTGEGLPRLVQAIVERL